MPIGGYAVPQRGGEARAHRRSAAAIDIVGEDRKLVAAEPRQQIAGAGDAAEPLDDELQHLIPDGMAVKIVDAFEAVEIQEEESARAATWIEICGRAVERGEKRAAVGQSRQRILHRELAQLTHLAFEPGLIGDVAPLLVDAPCNEQPYAADKQHDEQRRFRRRYDALGIGELPDEHE